MGIAALLREQANSKQVLRSHHRPQQAARGESHTQIVTTQPPPRHTQGLLLLRHLRLGFSEAAIRNESLANVVESHIESLVLGQTRLHTARQPV